MRTVADLIQEAVEDSTSHDRIEYIIFDTVEDFAEALRELRFRYDYLDDNLENDGSHDVYSIDGESEWRLNVSYRQKNKLEGLK